MADKRVLERFVRWLMRAHPDRAESQSAVARKADVSQTLIYKLASGFRQTPTLDTYRRLTAAYPLEWQEFLDQHPEIRAELVAAYAWVYGGAPPAEAAAADPRKREALAYLDRIFSAATDHQKAMVVQGLRAQAELVAQPDVVETPGRRRRARR